MGRGRRILRLPIHGLVGICWILSGLHRPSLHGDDTAVVIQPRGKPGATGSADRSQPSIRVNSELVLVPVTVTDRRGQFVSGLERKDFQVFEDRIEQPIKHFALEDTPVSVVVLFDCSGSMAPKWDQALGAVTEFLRSADPEDEFALVEFSDRARLLINFTTEHDRISKALTSASFKGQTALFDAICLALNKLKSGRHRRKALFIISDGGDNHSRYTKNEVRDRVRETDAQIYSIAVTGSLSRWLSPEEISGPKLLDELAKLSGGQSFEVANLNDLANVGGKLGEYLRTQYVLGYSPATPARDGKYHRIYVKLAVSAVSSSLRVRSRAGYLAREP